MQMYDEVCYQRLKQDRQEAYDKKRRKKQMSFEDDDIIDEFEEIENTIEEICK